MVAKCFNDVFKGRNILVTGHTGFKGSWLSLWLSSLGGNVTGLSLEPNTNPSHWELLKLNSVKEFIGDIRDKDFVSKVLESSHPEIIFHLAAQPLVRDSYLDPELTWSTNVIGTLNLLEASRKLDNLLAILIVTTDKCYENKELNAPYSEQDQLGGYDPYSASKAAVELLVSSHRRSFYTSKVSPHIASARAGNVIGGGDWSKDRLVPDLIRSLGSSNKLVVRYPDSTRPWQHVLDCLSGYLLLAEKLIMEDDFSESWNFGPDINDTATVRDVLDKLQSFWPELNWKLDNIDNPHEANLLQLNSLKARSILGWEQILSLDESLKMTSDWYSSYLNNKEIISVQQLNEYQNLAKKKSANWINL